MEYATSGQNGSLVFNQSFNRGSILGRFKNKCLVSLTSRFEEPEMVLWAFIKSVGSKTDVQFSHWSPRAFSYPQ